MVLPELHNPDCYKPDSLCAGELVFHSVHELLAERPRMECPLYSRPSVSSLTMQINKLH